MTLIRLHVLARNQRCTLGNRLSYAAHAISDQILAIPFLLYPLAPIPALHSHGHSLSPDSFYLLLSRVSPHKSQPPHYQKDFSRLPIWLSDCQALSKSFRHSSLTPASHKGLFFFPAAPCGLVGSWFPDQGLNPGPQQWKHRVLTTGPPGNSLKDLYNLAPTCLSNTIILNKLYSIYSKCLSILWMRGNVLSALVVL